MPHRCSIGAVALTALSIPVGGAHGSDDAKYPDWSGQWSRFVVPGIPGQPSHDQTKPWGFGQQAPLTSEYEQWRLGELAAKTMDGGTFGTWGACSAGASTPAPAHAAAAHHRNHS
jgi:hypothetical protein